MLGITAIIERLTWTAGYKTHASIASELGVSRATITRYITGIRTPPIARFQQLERMYERTVYDSFRLRGLAPQASAKYRSLKPSSVDLWSERLEDTISYRSQGTAMVRVSKKGLEWAELTDEEQQAYYDEAEETQRDALERSEDDIEEYVESP